MFNPDQKRLLALDGGGIMGMITLQFLKRMEDQLRPLSGRGADFRLCHFFDYIGDTSTGAIIAAGLSIGKSVDDMIEFYETCGKAMFRQAHWYQRFWFSFQAEPLRRKLQEVIGKKTLMEMQDSDELKSLLLVVMRNITTDSPWPITTNPAAKYNDRSLPYCNLKLPLWQLVRASTAAPTYFKPEKIPVGDKTYQFVDGGVTPYNNPAFLLFKMATRPEYRLKWPSGEEKMMLVSVGTGLAYAPAEETPEWGNNMVGIATTITSEVMRGIQVENDINCRAVGRCVSGCETDSELGAMMTGGLLSENRGALFLYARYDADISAEGLKHLRLEQIDPKSLKIDRVDRLPELKQIGQAAAERLSTWRGSSRPSCR